MATMQPTAIDDLGRELSAVLDSSALVVEHPVGAMTTYRVGGVASLYVEVNDSTDLAALAGAVSTRDVPAVALGRGSNLLVSDDGFTGLVVKLGSAFEEVVELGEFRVRVGAATPLPTLARRLTAMGLAGFEWAVGVPGSVGGAVRMNAGGHGSDMAACVSSARIVDLATGENSILGVDDLAFSYRSSSVGSSQVVEWATLTLTSGEPKVGEDLLAEVVRWRRENQPGGQNAGSVFTNPTGASAGRLIDEAGLKSLRVGSASVSDKHANFIQVDPGGCAGDVVELMHSVVRRVRDHSGVTLVPETRFLGFGEDFEW